MDESDTKPKLIHETNMLSTLVRALFFGSEFFNSICPLPTLASYRLLFDSHFPNPAVRVDPAQQILLKSDNLDGLHGPITRQIPARP